MKRTIWYSFRYECDDSLSD